MLAEVNPALIVIPAAVVQFIVTLLLPILTGLITKITLSATWKAFILMLLSTLTAFFARVIDTDTGQAVFTMELAYNAAINFGIAWAMYSNIYKRVGLTSSATNGKLGPAFGIGPEAHLGVEE